MRVESTSRADPPAASVGLVRGRWIFGYGSLVNPVSFGVTLGRPFTAGRDFHYAVLSGWGRRWNYGVGHVTGRVGSRDVRIVALGLVAAPGETANGVIGWVEDHEIERLDNREREYDRVDVTYAIDVSLTLEAPVETYVPRPEAVARYERHRADGTAAIEQRYWDLVSGAFAAFGAEARRRYFDTTPAPDVPILEIERTLHPEPTKSGQDLSANGD